MSTELSKLSLSQLATHYNTLPGVKPVKRFASRADALRRIERAQKAPSKPAAQTEPKAVAQKATTGPTPVRPGSKRERFVNKLIDTGITYDWAEKTFGWSRRDVGDVLRQLAQRYGYSYDTSEVGVKMK